MIKSKDFGVLSNFKNYPFIKILFLLTVFSLANRIVTVFYFSYNIGGLEDYIVYLTLKTKSFFLYRNPDEFPFEVNQYTPLYYFITKILSNVLVLFGISEVKSVYITGRSLGLAANLAGAYFIYKGMKLLLKDKFLVITASLICFNFFIAHHYSARPDSLKVMFLLMCAYSLILYLKNDSIKHLMILCLLSTLSILTKQDAFIFTLAFASIIYFYKNQKHSFIYLSLTVALASVFLLIVSSLSLNIFYKNLLLGISQGTSISWVKNYLIQSYFVIGITLIILFVSIMLTFKYNFFFLGLTLITSTFLILMSMLKWGSDVNYLTELQIFSFCILVYFASKYQLPKLIKFVLVLGTCLAISFYNHQYVRVVTHWSWNDALVDYKYHNSLSKKLKSSLDENKIDYFISFEYKIILHNYQQSVMGTMVNEYPEYYYPNFTDKVKSMPNKTYNYAYDFKDSHQIALISDSSKVIQNQYYMQSLSKNKLKFITMDTVNNQLVQLIKSAEN